MSTSLRILCFGLGLAPFAAALAACDERSMEVTATAYTHAAAETAENSVGITAWGDRLKPGMKALAVSRDLIDEGLDHEAEVEIEGFDGTWIVRDKMNKRWRKKIDIYMGSDQEAALDWGKRKVTIRWQPATDEDC